jgi:hypothetical protein
MYPWQFVLYALFVLALVIAFAFLFVLTCVLTCCIVVLPYVGTVILLPFYVTYRIFSLEFLAQFDPDFDPFTAVETVGEIE